MHLQSYNHLKYRGYYYDGETGFYYLNSRYYDPVLGRFINADGYVPTGITFEGCNMYAYCLNNPVNMHDSNGNVPEWLEELAKYTGGLASAAAMATRYRGQKKVARADINKSLKSYGENCKISFNDSAFEVTDSYKVSSIDFEKICVVEISVGITPRTVDNMMAEWRFHNVVYFLSLPYTPIITKKAKDASMDYIEDPRTPVKFFTYIFDVRKWD